MEKEEKLDEILRAKTGESQSNILNLYKSARVLLNKGIEAGKGKVYLLSNGRAEYSLGLDTEEHIFLFIYNNFDFPHLKIQTSKAFYAENQFGGGSRQYNEPQLVLDVKENRGGHLDVATYVAGNWEKLLENEADGYVKSPVSPEARKQIARQKPTVQKIVDDEEASRQ